MQRNTTPSTSTSHLACIDVLEGICDLLDLVDSQVPAVVRVTRRLLHQSLARAETEQPEIVIRQLANTLSDVAMEAQRLREEHSLFSSTGAVLTSSATEK